MAKDKTAFFTIADLNNFKYYTKLKNSLRKFHPDIELIFFGQKEINKYLKSDPAFFYRATPILAQRLMASGYKHLIKIDSDSIITGDLSYILESEYEVGTVLNYSQLDADVYGEVGLLTIAPQIYFNCGLVAMRSRKFVDHWLDLCNSPHFDQMPYREQGFLNILGHYGTYKTRCFDFNDVVAGVEHWYGLAAKDHWVRAELKGDDIVIPALPNANPTERTLKVIHFAEGNRPNKMDYQKRFQEPVIKRINNLVAD